MKTKKHELGPMPDSCSTNIKVCYEKLAFFHKKEQL